MLSPPPRAMARRLPARCAKRWGVEAARRSEPRVIVRFSLATSFLALLATAQLAAMTHAAAQDALSVPSCELFLQIGRRWVGIAQERATQVLKVPLSELTNDGIERIREALVRCL